MLVHQRLNEGMRLSYLNFLMHLEYYVFSNIFSDNQSKFRVIEPIDISSKLSSTNNTGPRNAAIQKYNLL